MVEKHVGQIKIILSIFLGILILYLMRELSNLLIPLVFALFFAVLLQPVVEFFERFTSTGASVVITTIVSLIVFLSIGYGVYNMIHSLAVNSDAIIEGVTNDLLPFLNEYGKYFGVHFQEGELRNTVAKLLQSGSFWSASGSFLNTISGVAADLLMVILYFAALLGTIAEYEKAVTYIVNNQDKDVNLKYVETFGRIKNSVSAYIKVKTFVSLITGTLVGLISWGFGIDYALLWGVLAFALNYIPYVGSIISIVPPIILGIIAFDDLSQVFILFVCLEGAQLLMGNVIEPKWMGDSFSMNTVSVLFGFVFWAFMWGTAGMLLAVPLTFLTKVLLENMTGAGVLVRLMDKKSLL